MLEPKLVLHQLSLSKELIRIEPEAQGILVLINVKDREKGCNIIFFFQEPSLTTTNGGPRAIFQCNYLAKFLQNIDEFFLCSATSGFWRGSSP